MKSAESGGFEQIWGLTAKRFLRSGWYWRQRMCRFPGAAFYLVEIASIEQHFQ